jgi:flagellar biogenesis protein FliO
MTGYLLNFIVYTSAMIGIIFLALFAFKTFSTKCFTKKSLMLNIEDSMGISPRKTLYVINADNERFLIAADVDRTTLISKLNCKAEKELKLVRDDKSCELKSFDGLESMNEFTSILDFKKESSDKEPMMRKLAKKLSAI